MNRVIIYTSKKKSILLLIGSTIFVTIGVWFLLAADYMTLSRGDHPIFIRGIGIVSILFFGLGIFIGIKRLIKSEIALIIDSNNGLNINPKKSMTEFIKWDDITGFDEISIQRSKIIIIRVRNPELWIKRETNFIRKKMMQFSSYSYGSPFSIAAAGLDISPKELNEKLNACFRNFNTKMQQDSITY